MVARAETLGCEVVRLKSDRLSGLPDTYRGGKTTRAVITASPSHRRLEPIPPNADWRFDLARPPIVRAYANWPEILAVLVPALGHSTVTSRGARASEGTTSAYSCASRPSLTPWSRS